MSRPQWQSWVHVLVKLIKEYFCSKVAPTPLSDLSWSLMTCSYVCLQLFFGSNPWVYSGSGHGPTWWPSFTKYCRTSPYRDRGGLYHKSLKNDKNGHVWSRQQLFLIPESPGVTSRTMWSLHAGCFVHLMSFDEKQKQSCAYHCTVKRSVGISVHVHVVLFKTKVPMVLKLKRCKCCF